ncbi:putative multidrug resistance protein [Camellia lanceoleosa]|uniref:Multidrug resistance protein n=1 Tax=Camellia lanceoleosa TaxID=1840588 RepID=A0ACC0G643_9ERIC|nr:putative multidrug resistance protein [Camellia lanceoleosa]
MGSKGGVFRFVDGVDKLLLLFGTLGCIGDGMMTPLTMFVLSGVVNEYGSSSAQLSFSIHVVDKYSLRLLYVATLVGVSAFMEGICWTRTAERQTSRMRMEYLKSVLRQEVGFFDNQTSSSCSSSSSSSTFQVVSTISSDAHLIQDLIAEKMPNCLANLSAFTLSLTVSFLLSWRLAVAALPFSLLFIIPGVGFGKVLMGLAMKMRDAYGISGGIAEQSISSIRTVYSYVGERQTLDRFSNSLQKCVDLGIKQGITKGLLIGSMGMVYAAWAFQVWVGSLLVTERGESGGRIFISAICVIYGGISIMTAIPNLSYFAQATAAAKRIFEMIDRNPLKDAEDVNGKILAYVRGKIEPETPVLQGFNLKVKAGKTVGLVGGSGSGKSTIVSLLERFYDPVEGHILLDGYKIKRLRLKWLRSQMGLVNQEPVLFATSIKENILFGKGGAPMELVISAAKAANAHDFIVKFSDGYETQVNPKILLLDEATSALDAQSEKTVQEALDKASLGRTTIVIAHRLATIREADMIVLIRLNNGGGTYFRMVQLQQSTAQNDVSNSHYHPSEVANNDREMIAQTPKLLPVSNFSPGVSVSVPHSIQMYSYDDSDDENLGKSSYSIPSKWRLLRMNAPEWKQALLGCLGAASFGAVQPVYAYCLGSIVSVYFLEDNPKIKSETKFYCIVFLSLAVISFFVNLLQHYNFAIMGERLTKRVREKLLENMLSFEIGWFDKDENTSAAICARLATEANMVRSLVGDRMALLSQVFVNVSLAYVLALVVTWRVAIVMIAIHPLIVGSLYSKNVLMKSILKKAKEAQNKGSQLASEAVVNHRTISGFSSQKKIFIKQSWFSGFGLFSSQFLSTASIALTYWYGGRLMNQGLVTSKHLFQVFFILMSTSKNIADAGSMTSDLAKGGNAIRSIFAILDRKTEIEPDDLKGINVEKTIKGFIELKNVFFFYPSRPEQMIFQGLSLKIEAGKTIALVGQSGSGKSTVIGLVERFYDPIKGSILIDGQDIKEYNLRSLRSHIALVSQEPTLFGGTIRENIIYGKEDATETEVREAAILANAHEFISSMKDGYNTDSGERGVQLSGGQKQRIALARAILKNPSILLLDEATSALDSASEHLVQEALEKMMVGRTCVIVAHRLSTIQKSDSIAMIKNGKVAEQGSHSDLLAVASQGSYYSLIKLQTGQSSYP